MDKPREHISEIDLVKGLAILLVVCIHAQLAGGTAFFRLFIDRAVMFFLILFGITSELWWTRELTRAPEGVRRRWYKSRFKRLLPGYWAMIACWWLAVLLLHNPDKNVRLGPTEALLSFFAYAPWVGTSWFVLVILIYVLLFPVIRACVKAQPIVSLVITALLAWASGNWRFEIIDAGYDALGSNAPWPYWYYYWIFPPRTLYEIVAGICVARYWPNGVSARWTIITAFVTFLCVGLLIIVRGPPSDPFGPIREVPLTPLVDLPITVTLLGFFRFTPLPKFLHRFLAWCGRWSWGLYLGHLLMFELMRIGGFDAATVTQEERGRYAIFLLLSGAAFAALAQLIKGPLSRALTSFTHKQRPEPAG